MIAVNDDSGDQTTAFLAYYSVDKARVVKKIKIRREVSLRIVHFFAVC